MLSKSSVIAIVVVIISSFSLVYSQDKNMTKSPDTAFLESVKTEIHPERDNADYPNELYVKRRFVYGVDNGRQLEADIFTPIVIPEKARPAIVFLHGGAWMFGDPSQFHIHAVYLAEKYGFFAMSLNYRTSIEARFPAALHDAKCAIRWLHSRANDLNIDPEKIAICGGSAGGHLSSMVATTAGVKEYEGDGGYRNFSSEVNLAIIFNGEFDMWDLVNKGSLIQAMQLFIGGTPEELPEKYDELSSIKRIHESVPPVLLLHGTVDMCVSHEQALAFHSKMQKLGNHSEIELYEGKAHAWFNSEPDKTITIKRMEKFLIEQFKLN
ncbi:alpha/beta hydrolase fold domain-containing protein [Candidatus Latescibacterota bacterium]